MRGVTLFEITNDRIVSARLYMEEVEIAARQSTRPCAAWRKGTGRKATNSLSDFLLGVEVEVFIRTRSSGAVNEKRDAAACAPQGSSLVWPYGRPFFRTSQRLALLRDGD